RAPDRHVLLGIVGAGDPEGAAAVLPGIVVVLPGLRAGLARRRDGIGPPQLRAVLDAVGGDVVARAGIAAGAADDDLVADDQRRRGQVEAGILRRIVRLDSVDQLAGLGIGPVDAMGGDGDHLIAGKGAAAVDRQGRRLVDAGVHRPDDRAAVAGG